MTDTDFHEIFYSCLCVSNMKNPKILDFSDHHGPRNGSSNFDLFVMTPKGKTPISQLIPGNTD